MKAKRIIAVLLCLCISFSAIPLQVFAAETTGETIEAESKPTNSLGQIGGYLIGNSMTTSNLFAEYKFSSPTGFGFAAERANNLIDQFKGLNSTVVGDDNLANGPDRMIINRDGSITWIQDKYGSTASSSVDLAFDDKTGMYRYMDGSGKPMQLEVPADQYDKAVDLMKTKISEGKVPGVTDPEEATNLIRKGHLTFKQAVNVAKAGTVESLVYDSAKGIITASCAAGMYSTGKWCDSSYCVKAAISDTPWGEFDYYTDIMRANEMAEGPGHNGAFSFGGKDYVTYHRRIVGDKNSHHRILCIDELKTENGRLQPVIMTEKRYYFVKGSKN